MGIRASTVGDETPWPAEVPDRQDRPHPQESFSETIISPESFFGDLRSLFVQTVLLTQLQQLRKQGSYHAFNLQWNTKYDIRKLHGAKCPILGSPPTLYWDSDVGKWIEAACYFLSTADGKTSPLASEFDAAIEELVAMIIKAQQADGYLGTYFTVVDPKGRLKNLRDMHEMYCCGHLVEAALAHHHYTGRADFLNAMIRYVDLLSATFGPGKRQRHGYPGHPELELAVLRLYSRTKNPKHYAFAKFMLEARGTSESDLGDKTFFVWEAEQRRDTYFHRTMSDIRDGRYHQWHAPLHDQTAILGHAVRAMYLLTAAADMEGDLHNDAKRLWTDAVDNKMYVTGGIGSVPEIEGFSEIPHFLPNSTAEGGCYAETCASIACMMVSERLLSHRLDGKVRDVMERCLYNTVIGGASLDGKTFYYANPLATSGDEVADRSEWFDVCCCPPNLCRTVGLIGGYAWSVEPFTDEKRVIHLNVYLYLSATRSIPLPDGSVATVEMKSEMPWSSKTTLRFHAPEGWSWRVNLPRPGYASRFSIDGQRHSSEGDGSSFVNLILDHSAQTEVHYDMPIRVLSPHPSTHQDTVTVTRGPIVYSAEAFDNAALDRLSPHFDTVGLLESASFTEARIRIGRMTVIALDTRDAFQVKRQGKDDIGSTKVVNGSAQTLEKADSPLRLIPFFARCNRQKDERIRTSFIRVPRDSV
ncbi:hypothetical protein BD324DRAFT_614130 [Kockovaella imperatae]|uniref:Six-hairpin glycosidase-like protein n=1 Tax=Kockovaella imperatae TaxID=4999 RepID=A0A1Y1UNI5_9TREE|nr:hypothetical protein BD324DRAFT_614130 [Kockovaella imperatae]ORX39552.1 hypothetical protein BD324DRAFT_614130 [Kockovaella imperatae]